MKLVLRTCNSSRVAGGGASDRSGFNSKNSLCGLVLQKRQQCFKNDFLCGFYFYMKQNKLQKLSVIGNLSYLILWVLSKPY